MLDLPKVRQGVPVASIQGEGEYRVVEERVEGEGR
jgi:hypothetical protein